MLKNALSAGGPTMTLQEKLQCSPVNSNSQPALALTPITQSKTHLNEEDFPYPKEPTISPAQISFNLINFISSVYVHTLVACI